MNDAASDEHLFIERDAGGLGAGLLTLLLVVVAFLGAKGIATVYFPGAPETPNLTVAGTPEHIARGEYFVHPAFVGRPRGIRPGGRDAGPVAARPARTARDPIGVVGATQPRAARPAAPAA